MTDKLADLRVALDKVDRSLVQALADRQDLVGRVARLKAGGGSIIRDQGREEALLRRLVDIGKEVGADSYFVTRVFREVLDQSLRVQLEVIADHQNPERGAAKSLRVVYQGGEGAYSHMAAKRHFAARDADVTLDGFDSFRGMLEAVKRGDADYAVLPIENTTAGSINESYDLLAKMNLHLVGEEVQKVEHCLVALEDVPLSNIRRIYSHPVALLQCRDFLGSLSGCQVEAFRDTALSVAKIKDDRDLSQAAIASEEAARLYGLPIIKRNVADQKQNYTRMVIVAREAMKYDPRIACKTSLILATRHEEGALARCIQVLAENSLSMTKLESRPRPNTPWEYLFYIDFEGNVADDITAKALQLLAKDTSYLKVLGSYPARTTKETQAAEPKRALVSAGAPADAPAPLDEAVLESLEKKPYRLASRANRAADTVIPVGNIVIGGPSQVVIAGPRMVESKEQLRAAARIVAERGAHLLRGGCFRPRRSPAAEPGLGLEGLELLEAAGREFGLPVLTEVLHPADVDKVAAKIDVLVVGAANMQNFALLEAVGHVDRPVLLERGSSATIDDWLAAAEYVLAHGNQQVVLCERGIRTFESATRTTLDLSAVPIVRERTHLPIVVDPSHALGARRWIPPMAVAALATGAHGIVLELQPEPREGEAGGEQALTFGEFDALMGRILP